MEAHDPIREVAPGLWCIDGDWKQTAFRRRMTLMGLANGDLVVHSAILMTSADMATVGRLGRVRAVVIPNSLHGDEGPLFAQHFTEAQLYAPVAALEKFRKLHPAVRGLETAWPAEIGREVPSIPIEGTRMHESAFVHLASRTLVLTDLVFNMPADAFRGFERRVMGWNGIVGRFGPSRIMKWFMTRDRDALFRSLERLYEHDFDRVIMNHGRILESGGKERLRESFAERWR